MDFWQHMLFTRGLMHNNVSEVAVGVYFYWLARCEGSVRGGVTGALACCNQAEQDHHQWVVGRMEVVPDHQGHPMDCINNQGHSMDCIN